MSESIILGIVRVRTTGLLQTVMGEREKITADVERAVRGWQGVFPGEAIVASRIVRLDDFEGQAGWAFYDQQVLQ